MNWAHRMAARRRACCAPTVVELFAGGGGAATGLARAGWHHLACVEWDREACGVARRLGLPVVRADVGACPVDARPDLVWASPPCQPYSSAGKRAGKDDARDGFPMMFAALDVLRPTWLLIEQVPGLTMHSAKGCGNAATCPGCCLEREILPALRARFASVEHRILSAADFGAPQDRRRLIIACGPRAFPWPASTHSLAALARAKRAGSYWRRHGIPPMPLTDRERAADDGTGSLFAELDDALPWRTVRDALGGLNCERHQSRGIRPGRDADEPAFTISGRTGNDLHVTGAVLDTGSNGKPGREAPRSLDEEARTVSGRGNAILRTVDDPAYAVIGGSRDCGKRVKAQVDPNYRDQARRRLSPAECALLQAWPEVIPALDKCRTKSAQYRIVGNAVPPLMSDALGRALRGAL